MSTALEIAADAYRLCKLDQELTSFDATLEFPYKLAKTLFNEVIREMNRKGHFSFTATSTALTYSAGVYTYDLSALGIDPKAIRVIRMEATDQWGELTPVNHITFMRRYRMAAIPTQKPVAYTKYADTLELNAKPDQDYSIVIYHYQDLPLIASATDTLLCQASDEDVFQKGIQAYLLKAIGRDDWQAQYQIYMQRLSDLLADTKKDTALPTRMPRAF